MDGHMEENLRKNESYYYSKHVYCLCALLNSEYQNNLVEWDRNDGTWWQEAKAQTCYHSSYNTHSFTNEFECFSYSEHFPYFKLRVLLTRRQHSTVFRAQG